MITLSQFTTKWKDNDRDTIVVIYDGQIVGTVLVDYGGKEKREALLWNLQVSEKHRHQGIGKSLFNAAVNNARARRCFEITLEWSDYDTDGWTLDWYKRKGFNVSGGYREATVKLTKRLNAKGGWND